MYSLHNSFLINVHLQINLPSINPSLFISSLHIQSSVKIYKHENNKYYRENVQEKLSAEQKYVTRKRLNWIENSKSIDS